MPYFNIIAESKESTVVTEYTPVEKNAKSYQTEAQLEAEFIRMLQSQGYEYLQMDIIAPHRICSYETFL